MDRRTRRRHSLSPPDDDDDNEKNVDTRKHPLTPRVTVRAGQADEEEEEEALPHPPGVEAPAGEAVLRYSLGVTQTGGGSAPDTSPEGATPHSQGAGIGAGPLTSGSAASPAPRGLGTLQRCAGVCSYEL
jgi:hypothetical protein